MNPIRALVATTVAAGSMLALSASPAAAIPPPEPVPPPEPKPTIDPWFGLDGGDPAGFFWVDPTSGGITDIGLALDLMQDYVARW